MINSLTSLALLFGGMVATDPPVEPAMLSLHMELARGDQQLGAPTLQMSAGHTASINLDGPSGFEIRADYACVPDRPGMVRVAANILLERNGRLESIGSPTVTTLLNEQVRMTFAPEGAQPVHWGLKVTPSTHGAADCG